MPKKHNPQELDLLLGFFIFSTLKKSNRNWLDFLLSIIKNYFFSHLQPLCALQADSLSDEQLSLRYTLVQ